MGETTSLRSLHALGAEFNAFLFEPIGADSQGGQVSVVSALARLDMDPWAEAERLSRLPDETAARSFCMLLARLPDIALGMAGPQQTALRLVRLLPHRRGRKPAQRFTGAETPSQALPRAVAAGVFCALAILIGGQMFWQSQHTNLVAPQAHAAASAVPAPATRPAN